MSNKRKKFSAEEKVRFFRLHLDEKRPISDVCDEIGFESDYSNVGAQITFG